MVVSSHRSVGWTTWFVQVDIAVLVRGGGGDRADLVFRLPQLELIGKLFGPKA
jgi:hypothetical protein